jgi:glycosyltransferase involved in cell wall biosynthesis
MHLAVDAHDLTRDTRGIGRYLRAVLPRIARRAGVRLTLLMREPLPWRRRRAFAGVLGLDSFRVANRVPRDADVVWHPWNGTFFAGGGAAVATIHDCAPFAFPNPDAVRRAREQEPFRRSAAAAQVLADSAFTRDEVQRHLGIGAERVTVVPLGVEPTFAPGGIEALPAELRGRDFIMHVGNHDAHKNVATLIGAHARAFPAGEPALVFTRRPAPGTSATWYYADAATLLALYRAATLVAVPSLYEGFGLPVLEAMACGTGVLASRTASLPEVGGDTIRYVDEAGSVEAWAAALREAVDAHAADAPLRARARERAATFSWERCAAATIAVLERAARR